MAACRMPCSPAAPCRRPGSSAARSGSPSFPPRCVVLACELAAKAAMASIRERDRPLSTRRLRGHIEIAVELADRNGRHRRALPLRRAPKEATMSALSKAETEPVLLRRDEDGIAVLTLNRPQARNALSVALMARLQDSLDAIAGDAAVRVVVIAGAGPTFCAGHDLREIRANPGRANYEALFSQCSRLMLAIMRLPKPVIARVHGVATAAGCQLVASCDLAVAAEDARFATPGVNIGLFCSTPMVALSRAVGRKAAMEM